MLGSPAGLVMIALGEYIRYKHKKSFNKEKLQYTVDKYVDEVDTEK